MRLYKLSFSELIATDSYIERMSKLPSPLHPNLSESKTILGLRSHDEQTGPPKVYLVTNNEFFRKFGLEDIIF